MSIFEDAKKNGRWIKRPDWYDKAAIRFNGEDWDDRHTDGYVDKDCFSESAWDGTGAWQYSEYQDDVDKTDLEDKQTEPLRYNSNKISLDSVDDLMHTLLDIVGFLGEAKYFHLNYDKGVASRRQYINAQKRHARKYGMGEMFDRETGLHHHQLAAWNSLQLVRRDLEGACGDEKYEDVVKVVKPELFKAIFGEEMNTEQKELCDILEKYAELKEKYK